MKGIPDSMTQVNDKLKDFFSINVTPGMIESHVCWINNLISDTLLVHQRVVIETLTDNATFRISHMQLTKALRCLAWNKHCSAECWGISDRRSITSRIKS